MPKTILSSYQLVNNQAIEWRKNLHFYRFMARNHNLFWGEGLYSRLVFNPIVDEYCVQVVSYYRYQLIPFHINDYHPIYLYYDKHHNLIRLLYDPGHHHSILVNTYNQNQNITIIYPWHPFELGRKNLSLPLKTVHLDLTDEILLKWWLQSGMPQFKLRSKFVDPWHHSLAPKNTSITGTFRDEIICPNCGKVHLFDEMHFDGITFKTSVECCKNTTITVLYDPESMNMTINGITNEKL